MYVIVFILVDFRLYSPEIRKIKVLEKSLNEIVLEKRAP